MNDTRPTEPEIPQSVNNPDFNYCNWIMKLQGKALYATIQCLSTSVTGKQVPTRVNVVKLRKRFHLANINELTRCPYCKGRVRLFYEK